jgi:hypothetical protein
LFFFRVSTSQRFCVRGLVLILLIVNTSHSKRATSRQVAYRDLFRSALKEKAIDDIRLALQQGQAVWSEKFKEAMSVASGVRRTQSKRGRPIKSENDVLKKLDQVDFGF